MTTEQQWEYRVVGRRLPNLDEVELLPMSPGDRGGSLEAAKRTARSWEACNYEVTRFERRPLGAWEPYDPDA